MTVVLVILWVIVLAGIMYMVIYNSIISAKNKVEETKSTIDVFLQNRYDLIPNLVEVVKKYAEHEKWLLEEVTRLRSELIKQTWEFTKDRFEKENQLTNTLKSIFAVWENYPDLKASKNFIALQNQWTEIEDNIAASRRTYNAAVKNLNDKKQMIPYSLIASWMNLPQYDYFEADEWAKERLDAKKLFDK